MKKTILSVALFMAISFGSFGQAPEGFKYQAVVRDAASNILNNQSIGMRLTIIQGSPTGTVVYTETFAPTTNAFGLVNLEIGTGTSTDDFTLIDWANGPFYIETASDLSGGTTYSVMGTSQLMSVPYALYAKTSGSSLPGPQGPIGADGPQGPAGNDGVDGAQGPIGLTGATGPQGPAGPTGAQGPQGIPGNDGATGAQGPIGVTGPAGAQGAQGVAGNDGVDGLLPDGAAAGNTSYWNGTSWVVNNSNIFNNGGNVGIGTTAPAQKLTVDGSIQVEGNNGLYHGVNPAEDFLRFVGNNATEISAKHWLNFFSTHQIAMKMNGADALLINNVGNIGMGTSTPTFKLDIQGTGGPRARIMSNDGLFAGLLTENSTHQYFVGTQATYEAADGTNSGFHIYDNTVGAQRFVIDAQGRTGIGTSAPESKLHIYGTGTSGAGSRITFGDDYLSTDNDVITYVGEYGWNTNTDSDALDVHGDQGIYFTTGRDLDNLVNPFKTSMFISGESKVGIGTTVPETAFQIGDFSVDTNRYMTIATQGGNLYEAGIKLRHFAHTNGWNLYSDEAPGNLGFHIGRENGGAPEDYFSIDLNGNIGIGTNAPSANLDVQGTVQIVDGTEGAGKVLTSDASGNASWQTPATVLMPTYEAASQVGTLNATHNGSLIYTQNAGSPIFPEDLPDGFTCTIVNYSNFAFTSNTLSTAVFVNTSSGNAGASTFTMAPGESVQIFVVTAAGAKRYYVK